MEMKKTKYWAICMATVILGGCSQAEEPFEKPDGKVPLQLNGNISVAQTRAFDTTWGSTDEIGVYTTFAGTTTITTSDGEADADVPYKLKSGSTTGFEPASSLKQIYLPADGRKVDVYAYYPYAANVSDAAPLNITVQQTQSSDNQKDYDVLMAKTASTNENPIWRDNADAALTFTHCLSKVRIRVVEGAGYNSELSGNISNVVITNQPTTATFAPISQQLTITNAATNEITPQTLASGDYDYTTSFTYTDNESVEHTLSVIYCYRAIILPNDATTNPSGNSKIVFTVGDVTYNYTITEPFDPGEQVTFTITLAATAVTITAEITPWTNNNIIPNPLTPLP